MKTTLRTSVALAFLLLAACETDSPASPSGAPVTPLPIAAVTTPAPSPAPSPTPAPVATPPAGVITTPAPLPSPTPTPAPSPTPSPPAPTPNNSGYPDPADDGVTVVVAEGDSISVSYVGYYAGYYKSRHPELTMYIHAVGGSGLNTLETRATAVQTRNPDIVTVFIGANDLVNYSSASAYFDRLMAYVAPFRARGSKVLVATNLPIAFPGNATVTAKHNALRGPLAALLRAAVGSQIDGVVDFEADPIMGHDSAATNLQLFSDGVHPTDRGYGGGMGGHDHLYQIYEKALAKAIVALP